MVEAVVVGCVERALEEFLKEDVELWEIVTLSNSSLYSLSGSGWKTRLKTFGNLTFCYSREFEIEKKNLDQESSYQEHQPGKHTAAVATSVVPSLQHDVGHFDEGHFDEDNIDMDSVGKGENVHEQVINREQKQNKTFAFASFLYPPNI